MAAAFDAEVVKRPWLLVVDLSGLSFIDSSALSVIMRTYRALHRGGSTLALVSPSPAVSRILQLVDIAQTIPVYANLQEAGVG
jgi:stage II sporulation protein AA (anti-sigma F factor antagonist)